MHAWNIIACVNFAVFLIRVLMSPGQWTHQCKCIIINLAAEENEYVSFRYKFG